MAGKYYWIKERHNPQFDKPYFVAYGNITTRRAAQMENANYGTNYMLRFDTKEAYEAKLKELNITE